jgi:competence protein ComEC
MMSNLFQKYRYYILFSLVVAVALIWLPFIVFGQNKGLKAWFLDVGQGDAIFLDFADGNQILIDGGPDREILRRLGGAMPFYDRHIDLVILTHPHKDHIFGLIEVLKMYQVDKIILPSIDFDSSFYDEFLRLVKSKNITLEYAQEGSVVKIGEYARFDFLSGPKNENKLNGFSSEFESFGEKGMTLNDLSLVSRFVFGKHRFYLWLMQDLR